MSFTLLGIIRLFFTSISRPVEHAARLMFVAHQYPISICLTFQLLGCPYGDLYGGALGLDEY